MNLKNQIVNYFVVPPSKQGGTTRVFLSPVTMRDDVGKKIIEDQLKKKKDFISAKNILHVCYDLDSKRIYLPNAPSFTKEQIDFLLKAAKIKISKDYGSIPLSYPIEGSPFSSIRIRSVSSFGYTFKAIKENFKESDFIDLPVIEANLARMPTTLKQLPSIYRTNERFVGGYIGPETATNITFFDEKELSGKTRQKKIQLLTQATPFILINISPVVGTGASEKEWAVLSGYRDFLYTNVNKKDKYDKETENFNEFADLYAIKRHLYLGWPFEEVCEPLLEDVHNFMELVNAINALVDACESLQKEGYPNPAENHYYITFKIDQDTFPLRLESMMSEENKFDPFKQLENFKIIEYDTKSKYILIETPAFISPNLCRKVLKAINRPLITRYNPAVNTIDVKSPAGTYTEYKMERKQVAKISALVNHDLRGRTTTEERDQIKYPQFRDDERARGISLSNQNVCHIRKLSEYYHATDAIKKVCAKNGIEFKDIDIVIGPIERIFGIGVQGGFMGAKEFTLNKLKIPYELEKGLFVSPPAISINSVNMPNYAAQTSTLIHEYSHNLYSISHPEHENLYNKDPNLKKKDELRWWELYFNDPDEIQAHIEQIKHELISGRSVDEIIRDKIGEAKGEVGGAITLSNYKIHYPLALKFKELVMEAVKELEQENEINEQPIGTNQKLGRNYLSIKKC